MHRCEKVLQTTVRKLRGSKPVNSGTHIMLNKENEREMQNNVYE